MRIYQLVLTDISIAWEPTEISVNYYEDLDDAVAAMDKLGIDRKGKLMEFPDDENLEDKRYWAKTDEFFLNIREINVVPSSK